ncbi:hypothetical protein [Brevundimonas goettingensis]|uniref:Lipoprotein n=1 Tax=Brevundimonas goettingensis TaxID=2774190 RepID=A0A975GXC4_9CAUL|nr:hypothetical protein [Brevundimonas goettingensis]QTC90385.1 hypothetical protein IFJ75_14015 [Brevundimonas goettingensis]
MTLRPLLIASLFGAALAVAACHSDHPEKSAAASAEAAAASADQAASDAAKAGADAAAASEAALQAGTQAAEAAGLPEPGSPTTVPLPEQAPH